MNPGLLELRMSCGKHTVARRWLRLCRARLLPDLNHISSLEQKIHAVEQLVRVNRNVLAAAMNHDGGRIAVAKVVRTDDGLCEHESDTPRHRKILHRAGERHARSTRLLLLLHLLHSHRRLLLAGKERHPRLGVGFGFAHATIQQQRNHWKKWKECNDARPFL